MLLCVLQGMASWPGGERADQTFLPGLLLMPLLLPSSCCSVAGSCSAHNTLPASLPCSRPCSSIPAHRHQYPTHRLFAATPELGIPSLLGLALVSRSHAMLQLVLDMARTHGGSSFAWSMHTPDCRGATPLMYIQVRGCAYVEVCQACIGVCLCACIVCRRVQGWGLLLVPLTRGHVGMHKLGGPTDELPVLRTACPAQQAQDVMVRTPPTPHTCHPTDAS